MPKQAQKWIGDKYVPYELPVGASLYETDMDKEISCCKCGRKVKYGDTYTSREIHTDLGIGYAECEDCYFEDKTHK